MILTLIFSSLCLILGFTVGWLSSERYMAYLTHEAHEFEELFQQNPHPELFDKDGKINKGEYMALTFDLGYDPEEFDPEDIVGGG